jgi:hypothetical protein
LNNKSVQSAFDTLQKHQIAKAKEFGLKDTQLEKVQASVNKFGQILKVIIIPQTVDPLWLDGMPFIELLPLRYNSNVNCILSDLVLQAKIVNDIAAFIENLRSVLRLERKRQKRGWGQSHQGQICPNGWALGCFEALQY